MPAWSPDGGRIAFTSDLDGSGRHVNYEIYVMNADGTGATRLTNNAASDGEAPLVAGGRVGRGSRRSRRRRRRRR